jgi:rhodanese-related sulfurtransferase
MTASITATELARLLEQSAPPHLLDVRQPGEFETVALPGAHLIPLPEIPMRFSEINDWKEQPIVVYCHHGVRSLMAIQFLRAAGFVNLTNLSGGIDAWSREVDPNLPRY